MLLTVASLADSSVLHAGHLVRETRQTAPEWLRAWIPATAARGARTRHRWPPAARASAAIPSRRRSWTHAGAPTASGDRRTSSLSWLFGLHGSACASEEPEVIQQLSSIRFRGPQCTAVTKDVPNSRSRAGAYFTGFGHQRHDRVAIEREVLLEDLLEDLRRDRVDPLVARDDVSKLAAEQPGSCSSGAASSHFPAAMFRMCAAPIPWPGW